MALMAGVMDYFLSHGLEHQPESLHYDVATCVGELIDKFLTLLVFFLLQSLRMLITVMDDFIDVQLSYVQMHLSSLEYTLSAKKVNSKYNRATIYFLWLDILSLCCRPRPLHVPRRGSLQPRALPPQRPGACPLPPQVSCH